MRIERLVTETEFHSVALDFHPRLTVVGGLDQFDRERLADEVISSLAGHRAGVHLELLSDRGARYAVFRPSSGRHRMVEIDTRLDVTESFTTPDGRIDLLTKSDLDEASAKAAIRLAAPDLLAASDQDRLVQSLANVNQSELWVAADGLAASQRQLEAEASAAADGHGDEHDADGIDAEHESLENLRAKTTQFMRLTVIALAMAVLALIATALVTTPLHAFPLIVVSAGMVIRSALMRKDIQHRAAREAEALAQFGAQSYLGYHIQRVNGLFDSEQARRSLMVAAEQQRDAFARWTAVAGDTDLTWALRSRAEIDAAARTRREVFGTDVPADSDDEIKVIRLAHSIVRRLGELRRLGVGDESFVAIFDEPFEGLDNDAVAPLLELLVRSSEQQQIVLLTSSPAVVGWAKVEAMTGALTVLEPNGPVVSDVTAAETVAPVYPIDRGRVSPSPHDDLPGAG